MPRLVVLVSALMLVLATGITPVVARAAVPVPKVALIVGPVGTMTDDYRGLADEAAKVARTAGAEVVRVYSPEATWPAVKAATDGASIVVYLGHGNGFPSRYHDELFPPTQNGFGLNPTAGVDDAAHQYFGESSIEDLHLAANAVVLLHHLCYASGNSEPGLAPGTNADAIARVDNYAAGFIRAGARAVVAEGHVGPAYYVRALLRTDLSIERIWARSPTAHGHTFALASTRSAGYTERLDPDRPDRGFYRSLVSAGVNAAELRASAEGRRGAAAVSRPPSQPTLVADRLAIGLPILRDAPVAGAASKVTLPMAKAHTRIVPKGTQVGIRWDPISVETVVPTAEPASAGPAAPAAPGASAGPATAVPPASGQAIAGTQDVAANLEPAEPPDVDLVVPEQLGTVVELAGATAGAKGLLAGVRYPAEPGLYRLVITLHTAAGVAYDAATQALLTPLLVRVGGPVSVAWGVPAHLSLSAGAAADVSVRVVNTGSVGWEQPVEGGGLITRFPATLVATWLSSSGLPIPAPSTTLLAPEAVGARGGGVVKVPLVAPSAPGDYLLVLDVLSPVYGPLSAIGNAPGLVRVTVDPSPDPEATHPQGDTRQPGEISGS